MIQWQFLRVHFPPLTPTMIKRSTQSWQGHLEPFILEIYAVLSDPLVLPPFLCPGLSASVMYYSEIADKKVKVCRLGLKTLLEFGTDYFLPFSPHFSFRSLLTFTACHIFPAIFPISAFMHSKVLATDRPAGRPTCRTNAIARVSQDSRDFPRLSC